MKEIKVYVLIDKKTGDLMSYDTGKKIVFSKIKKDVETEYDSKIVECIITLKFKGIDY